MSGNNGTNTDNNDDTSPYGYDPSKTIAVIFLFLFAITTITHLVQAIKYRVWFMLWTAFLCGLLELLGWGGRAWSSWNVLASLPFELQIVATIIAPTPLVAANFVIFGRIVRQLGQKYSRLTPRKYTALFTTSDVISLIIQGYGGGVAASADTLVGANKGAHIMLVGITFQLIIVILFSATAIEYFMRYSKDVRSGGGFKYMVTGNSDSKQGGPMAGPGQLTSNLKIISYALAFNMSVLFIRAIYRVIELSGGWDGTVIHTQVYFILFDGAMVLLALYTSNFVHPGKFLDPGNDRGSVSMMTHLSGDSGEV